MQGASQPEVLRQVGLAGATRVGVGAIVGGGILVLAGVAFEATGPGAILAFAVNGVIAALTALSFAEMSTAFPESGGAYAFGKRVLPVRAAFGVGWILGFAYLVAMVMYALGFASFAQALAGTLATALTEGPSPPWLEGRLVRVLLATLAILAYALALTRRRTGGARWATDGKLVIFLLLVGIGCYALLRQPADSILPRLQPFLPRGFGGLLAAMGFTFIAVQGFDLIAAIAGDVQEPRRTIPRAMLLSLGAALGIYLPLLFLVCAAGVPPGTSVTQLAIDHRETIIAIAAEQFVGPAGYWLVGVAAILATLSALHANLMAASRVSRALALDGTLPRPLRRLHDVHQTPVAALSVVVLCGITLLVAMPGLKVVAAAASLIFLISFALAHVTCILVRQRGGTTQPAFRTPLFPLVPVVGGVACLALAVFQAVTVPAAGVVVGVWLILGLAMYFAGFARRAEALDALAEARDPQLVRLRGRSPLVLVPMANPDNARAMVAVASALRPPAAGRVLLLTVVALQERPPEDETPVQLLAAERVLRQALTESIAADLEAEALLTVAPRPWREIVRVARIHRCESLLLGLSSVDDPRGRRALERILGHVDCDVSVLAAPPGWRLGEVQEVLVPVGGGGGQDSLRARLLGSLTRSGGHRITFLRVLPEGARRAEQLEAARDLQVLCEDEALGGGQARVELAVDPVAQLAERAQECDLLVLGLQRLGRRRKLFGDVALRLAREARGATIMISRRG